MIKRSLLLAMLLAQSSAVFAQSGARAADVITPQDNFRIRAEQAVARGEPFIEGFRVRPAPDLKPGSQLSVSLRGTPGAKVDMAIKGVRGVIELPEVRYGEYATSYTLRAGDHITEQSEVSVTMRFRNKVASKTLGQPLMLAASAPAATRLCAACATVQDVKVVSLSDQTAGAVGGSGGVTMSGPGRAYRYDVTLRYGDGRLVTMPFDYDPGFAKGERVRVNNGQLEADDGTP